jgi:hypothetical protein
MKDPKAEQPKKSEAKLQDPKKISKIEKFLFLFAGDEIVYVQFVFLKLLASIFNIFQVNSQSFIYLHLALFMDNSQDFMEVMEF